MLQTSLPFIVVLVEILGDPGGVFPSAPTEEPCVGVGLCSPPAGPASAFHVEMVPIGDMHGLDTLKSLSYRTDTSCKNYLAYLLSQPN